MSRDKPETKKRKVQQSGDALDDDLEYEVDSNDAGDVASINSESPSINKDLNQDEDEDEEDNVTSDLDEPEQKASAVNKAPKKVISPQEKRKKRKERKAITKKRKLEEIGVDDAEGPDVAASSVDLLNLDQQADLFARLIKDHASKDLTSIELSDRYFPTSSFLDTSSFTDSRNLSTISSFLTKFTNREDLKVATKEPGRPHTILLAQSAIRVADLMRSLKHLKHKSGEPAKLFGKEKVPDQVKYLQKTRINVAVGVPGRVLALIQNGSLKVDRVEQVYLDHSYRDAKKRGMAKIKEVTKDLVEVVGGEVLAGRIRDGHCKIILF